MEEQKKTTEEKIAEELKNMYVLDHFILVKQVMKKKYGAIIVEMATNKEDAFNYSFEVVQLGSECEKKIKIGDHPIFSKYVQFSGLKIIDKTEEGMISLIIVHENDVIAIDNNPIPDNSTDRINSTFN